MVTKREALEELNLPNLQKLADRLGVRVSQGLTGLLTKAMLGSVQESRRPYIEALASSDLVTLEAIDRILHTRYSRLPDDTRGVGSGSAERGGGVISQIFSQGGREVRANRFYSLEPMIHHVLNNYVSKPDLQKICQTLGLKTSGNKPDLANAILCDPRLTNQLALYYVSREDMRKLCEDLRLPSTGTRGEMEGRVLSAMSRLPRLPQPAFVAPRYLPEQVEPPSIGSYQQPQRPQAQPLSDYSRENISQWTELPISSNPGQPTASPEPLPPPPPEIALPPPPLIPARPELEVVVEFIEKWRPSNRFRDESKYEIELAAQLRNKFGDKSVLTQFNVPGGRIDIEVLGIGLELKVPSKVQMQRLVGQTLMYKKHYGPNIVAVIFDDKAKSQDIIAFGNDLRSHGIKVCVK